MKVTYRAKKEDSKFVCLKSFLWDGKEVRPGEEITIKDPPDQDGMVQRGAVWPVDLVDGLIYVSLTTFTLPGAKEKFETKAMSLVSLKGDDALRLMLGKSVLPRDPDQWRPFQMKLGPGKVNPVFLNQLIKGEQDKLFKDSISFLPSQKKKK